MCLCFFLFYNYSFVGYVIIGDVNLVNNEDLRLFIMKGLKFREFRFFNWCFNVI